MLRNTMVAAFALCTGSVALAQAASPYDGKWTGILQSNSAFHIELVLEGNAGTWRMSPEGVSGKSNQCFGKAFPVVVGSAGESEIRFKASGSQLLAGCNDYNVVLKRVGDKLEGATRSGATVKLSR